MTATNGLGALNALPPQANREATAAGPTNAPATKTGPQDEFGAGSSITEAFEKIVYQKYAERAAVSFQQVRTGGQNGAEAAGQEQLTFSFEAEFEVVELARFEQRIARAAEHAEGDARRSALLQAARSVSARFSISLDIRGAALNGFASGAEQSAETGGSALDRFLAFARDAFDQVDALFNELFETLDGYLNGVVSVETKFEEIFDKLRALFGKGSESVQNAAQQFSVQLEFEFESIEITQFSGEVQASDPVVLDLDGDGFEFTGVARGASFDLLGTGRAQRAAFVTGGDAFLAIDRNANGRVDDGTELFGDQRGAANGFEELRKLDSNADGVIDASDDRFDDLRLFRDNGDGHTDPGELERLADHGVSAIDLNYVNRNEAVSGGNRLAQIASFRFADGRIGRAADALLNLIV